MIYYKQLLKYYTCFDHFDFQKYLELKQRFDYIFYLNNKKSTHVLYEKVEIKKGIFSVYIIFDQVL